MDSGNPREEFDTGLKKIGHEIKSRLVMHGLYASVANVDSRSSESELTGSTVEITIKGRTVSRSLDRKQVESCHLRVGGAALQAVISMIDEISAQNVQSS
jgi:hypothetical protein